MTHTCKSISPYTGWNFEDWQKFAQTMMANAIPYFSPGKARVKFSLVRPSIYGEKSDEVEAFSRIFLLVGFWLSHRENGKILSKDGNEADMADIYRQGIINGTNPDLPEYWGQITGKHQYMVEAASIALSLFFSREHIWNNLEKKHQQNVGNWLRQILQFPFEDKNWVLFNVLINSFLKRTGQEYYQDQIDFYLDRFDSYYEADGWYRDGIGPQYDYYDSWALHFYPHIWSQIDPDIRRPELVESFRERTRQFLNQYVHFFSSTASHPPFGRSLIYRCGVTAAPVIACQGGFSSLSPGLTRRLCSQSLKYFADRNIFDEDGSVSLGWTHRFLPMAEKYSGPGSPLWMNKIFSAFLMSPDHAFWNAVEEPLPVDERDYCIEMQTPGFLVNGHRETGHIQLINQGSDAYVNSSTDWKTPASDFHYLKFSYSSHFFHDVGLTVEGFPFGNMISLYEEKRGYSHRERIYPLYIGEQTAISYHYPFGESFGKKRDSRIETAIIMKDDHQIRIHWILSPNLPLVYEGAYSLAFDEEPPEIEKGNHWISVRTASGQCCIRSLYGYDDTGVGFSEGMNPQGKNSCLPFLRTCSPVFAQKIVASQVIARPKYFDTQKELLLVRECRVEGRRFTVEFSDNSSVTVKLGAADSGEPKVEWQHS